MFLAIPNSPANANTSTSVVCYFQKNGSTVWNWGLDYNYNWFKLHGKWEKNRVNGEYRFVTGVNKNTIDMSCEHARRYYQRIGYQYKGAYASDSKLGKNHPIFSNGERISPTFF